MIRFFIRLVVWVTVAKWMCAETALVSPQAAKYIVAAMQKIEIPTHDRWSNTGIGKMVAQSLPTQAAIQTSLREHIGTEAQSTFAQSIQGFQHAATSIRATSQVAIERF